MLKGGESFMIHVPMDDIEELWNDLPEQNWESLKNELMQRKGKTEGISNNLINMMIDIAKDKEGSDESFPKNSEELYELFNSEILEDAND